jgi:hypothetical protein
MLPRSGAEAGGELDAAVRVEISAIKLCQGALSGRFAPPAAAPEDLQTNF